jgi:hypothetical protein
MGLYRGSGEWLFYRIFDRWVNIRYAEMSGIFRFEYVFIWVE